MSETESMSMFSISCLLFAILSIWDVVNWLLSPGCCQLLVRFDVAILNLQQTDTRVLDFRALLSFTPLISAHNIFAYDVVLKSFAEIFAQFVCAKIKESKRNGWRKNQEPCFENETARWSHSKNMANNSMARDAKKNSLETQRKTLFVRNLPYTASDKVFEDAFSEYGPIKRSFVVKDKGNVSIKNLV